MLLTAALVVSLAAQSGAYYPPAWGPSALAALAVAAGALLTTRRVPLQRREWWLVGSAFAWLAWVAAGAARPGAATAGMPEVERGALYLAIVWTALVVLRRETVHACLTGVLTGAVVVSLVGLHAELFPGARAPNAFEGRLLFQPVGYANAVGILAAVAIVLAIGFAGHGASGGARTTAAAALVPLVATLALTGSRGAVAALVAALFVLLLVDERRGAIARTLLAAGPLPLAAAIIATRTHVGDARAGTDLVARDGKLVAIALALLTATALASAHVLLREGRTWRLSRNVIVPPALLVAGATAVLAPHSLGDRAAYWRAAWFDAHAHPLLGSGPGSFAAAWLHYRDTPVATLDAHSLYLETLAELGPVGLASLLVFLAIPLAALVTARRTEPLTSVAAAAYTAFLVHAGLDWDWEMPAVTATVLVIGCTLVVAARRERVERRSTVVLSAAAVACALASLAAIGASIGNNALAGASRAAAHGDWAAAQSLAARAARWQPWSAEPRLLRTLSALERARRGTPGSP